MLILFLSIMTWAGGDWVGNGASLSENRLMMAYNSLDKYINYALADKNHSLQETQRNLLSQILISLPREKKMNPSMIQFKPHSSLFIIEGQAKVAVTGLNLGDTIYFNQDLLRRKLENNQWTDLSQLEAVSLLIHELGHHQGIKDHTFLDQLGAEVSAQIRWQEIWVPMNPRFKNLGAQLMNPVEFLQGSSNLNLVDREKSFDLAQKLEGSMLCENTQAGSHKIALNFWNLHWKYSQGSNAILTGLMAITCKQNNGTEFNRIGDRFEVAPEIKVLGGEVFFDVNYLRVDVFPCEKSNDLCASAKALFYKEFRNLNNFNR